MAALDRIFSAIADYSKAMGVLNIDFLDIVRRDIERFKELTDKSFNQMQWQAWSVVGLSTVSASLAVMGSLIPKGGAEVPALGNQRLGANDGISSAVADLLKKIDGDFIRSTCKTGHKFFNGVTQPANIWFQSETTKLDANRELMRLAFQEGQQERGTFSQETRRAQESALAILQAKQKGG